MDDNMTYMTYSEALEDHAILLINVFQILQEHKFLVKGSKCAFAQQSIEYLGHVISSQGLATEPTKLKSLLNWPVPKTVKELRGFGSHWIL